jgi:hypothetical protein
MYRVGRYLLDHDILLSLVFSKRERERGWREEAKDEG